MASIQHEADRKYKEECAEYWRNLLRKHLAGEPLTEEEERHLDGCRPVGPFHQEPVFGSPEAVAQAAELIRASATTTELQLPPEELPAYAEAVAQAAHVLHGFTPGPWRCKPISDRRLNHHRGYEIRGPETETYIRDVREDEIEANARLIAAAPDLLAERDRLRTENGKLLVLAGRLAAELEACRSWPAFPASANELLADIEEGCGLDLATALIEKRKEDRLRAEVDRLHNERENDRRSLSEEHCLQVAELEQQRDALAEALLLYTTGDDCGCCDGSPDQPQSTPCAYCVSMAALRKAGR